MKIFFKTLFILVILSLASSCNDLSYDPIFPEKGGSTSAEAPKMGKVYAEQTSATTATVTWSATDDLTPQNELSYDIHLSQQPNFTPDATTRKTTVLGTTKTDLTNLETNKAYYILVIATDKNGFQSVEREYVSVTLGETPKQPQFSGLSFSAPSDMDKATIAWQAATDDKTPANLIKYEIHLSQQENFEPTTKTLHSTAIGETQKVISGLSPATTYYATVIAVDQDGNRSTTGETHKITTLSEPIIANPNIPFYNDQEIGLANVSQNGTQYTFSKFNLSKLPVIGSVLFIHIGDEIHLRKVNTLTATVNNLIVETSDAALSDVLDQATISSVTTMPNLSNDNNVTPQSTTKSLTTKAIKKDEQNSNWSWKDGCVQDKTGTFSVCPQFFFQPKAKVYMDWKREQGDVFPTLKNGEFSIAGTVGLELGISVQPGSPISLEKTIFKKDFGRVYVIPVGVVTIPVFQLDTLEFKLNMKISGAIGGKFETTITANGHAEVGSRFNPNTNNWEPIQSPASFEFKPKDGKWSSLGEGLSTGVGMASIEARLIPEYTVKFYTLPFGPFASIEPFSTLEVKLDSAKPLEKIGLPPVQITQFDVSVGVETFAGVWNQAFGRFKNLAPLKDISKVRVFKTPDWPLLSLPSLSASGGSGKVNESISVSGSATDGKYNKFSDSSIKWYVDPAASISGGKTGSLTASKEGTYTVFFSGNGEFTKAIPQYAWADVNVGKKDDDTTNNNPCPNGWELTSQTVGKPSACFCSGSSNMVASSNTSATNQGGYGDQKIVELSNPSNFGFTGYIDSSTHFLTKTLTCIDPECGSRHGAETYKYIDTYVCK